MSKVIFEKTPNWESASKLILSFPGIRFIGVISNLGNLVVGNYKKGIEPIAKIDQYKICMEHTLELFMKKDLDDSLGSLDYIVSKRKKIQMITIPTNDYIVLISTEPTMKIEPFIDEIIQSLKDIQ